MRVCEIQTGERRGEANKRNEPKCSLIHSVDRSTSTNSGCVYFASCARMGYHIIILSTGTKTGFQPNKPLNIYKWHSILKTELEIRAVGTDVSRRTSWRAPEDPEGGKTWKSIRTIYGLNCWLLKSNRKSDRSYIEIIYFWMKLGAS
jgi:hypothetical protein